MNSVSLIKIKIQNVEYLIYSISSNKHTSIFSVFVRLEIICDVLSILERRTLARSFVLLVWLGFGWERLVVGNTIKGTKKWKTDSQEIPTTVIKKMDTGVFWVFVYLQVLIKLMKFLEHLIRFFFSLQHKFQETFILRIFISNLMNDYFITFTYCLQNI